MTPVRTESPAAADPPSPPEPARPARPSRGEAKRVCGCFGTSCAPLTNCLRCGRISCRTEGYGYCAFCGYLIEKVIVKEGGKGKLTEAELHKERLLRYDKELAQRTTVLDDQADYFEAGSVEWLTGEERAEGLGR